MYTMLSSAPKPPEVPAAYVYPSGPAEPKEPSIERRAGPCGGFPSGRFYDSYTGKRFLTHSWGGGAPSRPSELEEFSFQIDME